MNRSHLAAITSLIVGLASSPALAEVSVGVGLSIDGSAEIKLTTYSCEGRDQPLTVRYVNAAPNFLALIPIEGHTLVFVNTATASGAKYESGKYVWWDKGSDATLSDITEGLDAAPVLMCSEDIDTP
jgi:membrane-bound inhibitor of C-type lysozyme